MFQCSTIMSLSLLMDIREGEIFKLFVYFRRRECLAQNNYSNHSSHWCVEHSRIRWPIEQDNEFNMELMGGKIMRESLRVHEATN